MKKVIVFFIALGMCFSSLEVVHAQSSYRFLALGDSITYTPYTPPVWYNNCGMGASTAEMDWVHQAKNELKKHYDVVDCDVKNIYWQTNTGMLQVDETEVKELSESHPYDLVVIENTDQISSKKLLDVYEENLRHFVNVVKQYNPQAIVVLLTDFLADFNYRDMYIPEKSTSILNNVARDMNCHVASLAKITKNPNYMNQIGGMLYDKDGNPYTITRKDVALHPNDQGMKYIAYKVLEQAGITMDVGNSFADLTNPAVSLKNGWIKEKKNRYYYVKGIMLKGLYRIGNAYYCFDKDSGILRKGIYKKKGYTYYLEQNGKLIMYKLNGRYYNQDTQLIATKEGEKMVALFYAKEYLKKHPYKGKKRLQHYFDQIVKYKSKKKARTYTFNKTNPALVAVDFFNGKNSRDAKVCAFAYLAYALKQKNITIALHKKTNYVMIGKTFYQPNKADGFAIKLKDKVKKLKLMKAPQMKAVKTKKPTRIVKWDEKKKKLYYDNGMAVTGIAAYNNMFYAFDGQGHYDGVLTNLLRKAATSATPIATLKRLIGEPLSTSYHSSCFGTGDDGLLVYKNFIVSTFKSANDGTESYVAVKSTMQ